MISAIVIDNDVDMVDVFVEYLEMKQVEVLGKGYNGKDAVELYHKLKPDLVFLDLVMPEYDGLYGLEKIREYDRNAKVIIITSTRTYGRDMLEKLKPTGVFLKPFDINKLGEVLHTLTLIKNRNNLAK